MSRGGGSSLVPSPVCRGTNAPRLARLATRCQARLGTRFDVETADVNFRAKPGKPCVTPVQKRIVGRFQLEPTIDTQPQLVAIHLKAVGVPCGINREVLVGKPVA